MVGYLRRIKAFYIDLGSTEQVLTDDKIVNCGSFLIGVWASGCVGRN